MNMTVLSRLALRPNTLYGFSIRLTQTSASASKAAVAADGERDLVNFPRRERAIYPEPVRVGFLPESWFNMLYKKTGVTGPYVLGTGFLTFLFNKEYILRDHEYIHGTIMLFWIFLAVKFGGPKIAAALDARLDAKRQALRQGRDDTISGLTSAIAEEQSASEMAKAEPVLFEAKRENVGLQLEAAYRQRLQSVHQEVKKRLDYQLETTNVQSRFEQKHMVNWIVDSVRKSITPAQETASLKQCITDLKSLAAKA